MPIKNCPAKCHPFQVHSGRYLLRHSACFRVTLSNTGTMSHIGFKFNCNFVSTAPLSTRKVLSSHMCLLTKLGRCRFRTCPSSRQELRGQGSVKGQKGQWVQAAETPMRALQCGNPSSSIDLLYASGWLLNLSKLDFVQLLNED